MLPSGPAPASSVAPPPTPGARAALWTRLALVGVSTIILLRLASEFTGRGAPFWHWDLETLFHEQHAFYAHVYPHAGVNPGHAADRLQSDYPPYSFLLMLPWLPPGFSLLATRVWFTLCQLAAAAVIVTFAWRRGRDLGVSVAGLLAASVLAMTGLRADLLFGNYALLMIALLVAFGGALEGDRRPAAGAFWALGMLKPQMGWLFGLLLARRGWWRTAIGAVAALAVLAVLGCGWTGVTPFDILHSHYGSRVGAMSLQSERHNAVSLLGQWGVPSTVALVLGALSGLTVTFAALAGRLRDADVLTRLAFVGLVNRVCTYHNTCDDLLLVFALVQFGRAAGQRSAPADWFFFLLLGASVWAPTAALDWPAANALLVTAWLVCAAWIWRSPVAPARLSSSPAP
jgi:glycosyl transferase family 87